MHFPVSLLLSRLLLPHLPPAGLCLSEGRADSLVYSNAASSSVFITVTSLNPTHQPPFNPPQTVPHHPPLQKTHLFSAASLRAVRRLRASQAHLFINVVAEVIMSTEEFLRLIAAMLQTV